MYHRGIWCKPCVLQLTLAMCKTRVYEHPCLWFAFNLFQRCQHCTSQACKQIENLNIGLKLVTSILNLTHVCSINWNLETPRKTFRLNFLKAKNLIDGNLGGLQFGMCCMHQDPSYSGSIVPQDQGRTKMWWNCPRKLKPALLLINAEKKSANLFGGIKTCASPFFTWYMS